MTLISTFIDGQKKDYVLKNGSFEQSNELVTEAYSRIYCPLNSYIFDNNFGSKFPLWINTRTRLTNTIIANEVNRALTPLISSGRALTISTTINSILLNGFSCSINITDNQQNKWELPINYLNMQSSRT